MNKDEIEKKIEEIIEDMDYVDEYLNNAEAREVAEEKRAKLLNLYTEMVEGELRGFVKYVEKDMGFPIEYESVLMYQLKQYLLERKKNVEK